MKLTSNEWAVLEALIQQENAQDMSELTSLTGLTMGEVSPAVDSLVEKQILRELQSFHQSEIGTITYAFDDNDTTQALYAQLEHDLKHITEWEEHNS